MKRSYGRSEFRRHQQSADLARFPLQTSFETGIWGQDRLKMLEEAVVRWLRRDGLALGRMPHPSSSAKSGARV